MPRASGLRLDHADHLVGLHRVADHLQVARLEDVERQVAARQQQGAAQREDREAARAGWRRARASAEPQLNSTEDSIRRPFSVAGCLGPSASKNLTSCLRAWSSSQLAVALDDLDQLLHRRLDLPAQEQHRGELVAGLVIVGVAPRDAPAAPAGSPSSPASSASVRAALRAGDRGVARRPPWAPRPAARAHRRTCARRSGSGRGRRSPRAGPGPRRGAAGRAGRRCGCRRAPPHPGPPRAAPSPLRRRPAPPTSRSISALIWLSGCAPAKPGHRLAADEGIDRRHRLDAQLLGQLRVLVDVDLDQPDLALGRAHQLLEHRRQLLARAAPGRPEIDQHRHCHRGLDARRGRRSGAMPSLMMSASPAAFGAAAPPKSCIEATSLSCRRVRGRAPRARATGAPAPCAVTWLIAASACKGAAPRGAGRAPLPSRPTSTSMPRHAGQPGDAGVAQG